VSEHELEAFREEALARRDRARRTPFEQTPLGSALAQAIAAAKEAEASMSAADLERAKVRAERMRRRYVRAEARRMSVAKYHALLTRETVRRQAAEVATVRRAQLDGALVASRPRTRTERPRERHAVSRPRARAPDEPDLDRPGRLPAEYRQALRQAVSLARFERVAGLLECRSCFLELPLDQFRPRRRVCRDCENDERISRRRRCVPT
jgi:hypothetical protein